MLKCSPVIFNYEIIAFWNYSIVSFTVTANCKLGISLSDNQLA